MPRILRISEAAARRRAEAQEQAATRRREAARRRYDNARKDRDALDRIAETLTAGGDPYDALHAIEALVAGTGRSTNR